MVQDLRIFSFNLKLPDFTLLVDLQAARRTSCSRQRLTVRRSDSSLAFRRRTSSAPKMSLFASTICVLFPTRCRDLRAVSLNSAQFCARSPSELTHVCRAAFDAATETLVCTVSAPRRPFFRLFGGYKNVYWLMSWRCISNKWHGMQRVRT